MKRRDLLVGLAGGLAGIIMAGAKPALASGFGRPDPLRPGGKSRHFVISEPTTVHEATLARFPTLLNGLRFVRVGALKGSLQYLVNGRLPLLPARYFRVQPGDVIKWREV